MSDDAKHDAPVHSTENSRKIGMATTHYIFQCCSNEQPTTGLFD